METQTAFKNRVHKILQICNIRLASKLSNIFGKDGQMLLNALMNGESIDKVIDKYGSKRLKAKKEEVKASILGALGEADIIELKICLDNINRLEEQIRQLNAKIAMLVNKKDVDRISKVPGLGEISASAVIAEIGDPKRFSKRKESCRMVRPSTINIPDIWKNREVWTHHKERKQVVEKDTCPMRYSSSKSQKQPSQTILPKNKGKKRT